MSAKGVLPEFQEFLLTHKLAQEKHVLFLAVWVSKFLAFINRKGHQDLRLTVSKFQKSLEAKEDIKDWQLRQAGEAVRLYLNHFKGNEVLSAAQGKPKRQARLSDRTKLLAEMKRLIRLKHFAYNTERAYLDWVERFFEYMSETTESGTDADLTPEAVQNFLSHLAISKRVASSTQNQAFLPALSN